MVMMAQVRARVTIGQAGLVHFLELALALEQVSQTESHCTAASPAGPAPSSKFNRFQYPMIVLYYTLYCVL